MRVVLKTPKKGLPVLNLLQARVRKEAADQLMFLAKVALEVATEHTPKWSGAATESWKLSLNGEASIDSGHPVFEDSPTFEEGIHDSKAHVFNMSVVNAELNRIRLGVYAKVRAGKDVKITLYNSQPYATRWLSSNSLGILLRVVNQDYYTFNEICAEVKVSARLAKYGKW